MKVKKIKNLYLGVVFDEELVDGCDNGLVIFEGEEFFHTPTAGERDNEIETLKHVHEAREVFFLKHTYEIVDVDENLLRGNK